MFKFLKKHVSLQKVSLQKAFIVALQNDKNDVLKFLFHKTDCKQHCSSLFLVLCNIKFKKHPSVTLSDTSHRDKTLYKNLRTA